MKRYNGGTTVKGGYYFNLSNWEIVNIAGESGVLPGDAKYLYAPVPVLLIASPILGATFALFLPLIGFAMPIYALAKRFAKTEPREVAPQER